MMSRQGELLFVRGGGGGGVLNHGHFGDSHEKCNPQSLGHQEEFKP